MMKTEQEHGTSLTFLIEGTCTHAHTYPVLLNLKVVDKKRVTE